MPRPPGSAESMADVWAATWAVMGISADSAEWSSGPLLKSQTGRLRSAARWTRRKRLASRSQVAE